MATLREIRKRLRSVENIKQITKTMEMVAAARLRKAQAKAEQSRPYIIKMKDILQKLASSAGGKQPLMEQRQVKKTGLFIVAADKGLCGSYNTNVFTAADKFLKKYQPENIELVLMGRKAIDHYNKRGWKIRHQFSLEGEKHDIGHVKELAHELIGWFLSRELDEIWIVYTRFVSIMSRKVMVEKILNITPPETAIPSSNYIFEPSPEDIFAEALPHYFVSKLNTVFDEAYASELASRIISMRTATKNAEEMIYDLTLTRNKVRQAGITKEMLEIINGAQGV